jgi:hypothetical protein
MAGFADDYVPVAQRIEAFYAAHPDGSIQCDIYTLTDTLVVMRATVYRDREDPLPSIAHSMLAIPGKTAFTRGSEVENAETSAVGRAIAMLGFEVKRGMASHEEVWNKRDETPARQPASTFRERVNAETGEIDATAQAGGGSAVSTEAEPKPTPAGITTNFQKAIQGWLERKRLTWTNAAVLDVLGVSAATVNADGWEAPLDRWWTANGHNDGKGVVAFQKAVETRMKEMAG